MQGNVQVYNVRIPAKGALLKQAQHTWRWTASSFRRGALAPVLLAAGVACVAAQPAKAKQGTPRQQVRGFVRCGWTKPISRHFETMGNHGKPWEAMVEIVPFVVGIYGAKILPPPKKPWWKP